MMLKTVMDVRKLKTEHQPQDDKVLTRRSLNCLQLLRNYWECSLVVCS